MANTSARIPGTLYIVATPIGHREDISKRAINTLQSVDFIIAEDTRHSLPLLTMLGIKKTLISLHAHNETTRSAEIIDKLHQGLSCALISDAGTPLISDPGYPLVKLARSEQIPVTPIPGPCAFITALSAAGCPCDTVTFCGFLPTKSAPKRQRLTALKELSHTLIFYESTHRITETMDDIAATFGEQCEIILAKELTKAFERFVSGNTKEVKAWLLQDSHHCNGEFVVIIPPRPIDQSTSLTEQERILSVLLQALPLKQAVKLTCDLTKAQKNTIYETALRLQNQPNGKIV